MALTDTAQLGSAGHSSRIWQLDMIVGIDRVVVSDNEGIPL